MKVFDGGNGWGAKVNFVDDNNVFVGYDMDQSCCEYADWFIISRQLPFDEFETSYSEYEKPNIDGYYFDKSFFVQYEGHPDLDMGGCVIFKMVGCGDPLYLHLFNVHNGYYAHGFEFKINDRIVKQGTL